MDLRLHPPVWVHAFRFLPVREAAPLSACTCHTFREDVMGTLLRSVRRWRVRETASDAAVIALAERCTGLTTVHLSSCSNITDAAVIGLAERCTGLTTVDLRGCSNITAAAMEQLAGRFPAITLNR